jgi:hypothetical protein
MKDGMDLVEENGSSPNSIRLMRFLMGFLFVLGLFLIEIGIAEIILGNDFRCRETARSARLALDPYAACLPEATHYFFQVLSRGPFAIVGTQIASPIAWLVTGTLYGFLGGFLAQFSPRMAIVIYSGVHVAALFIMTVLTFLSNFIA